MGIGEFNTEAGADSSPVVSKLSLLINYLLVVIIDEKSAFEYW